ncbi:MAG: hypothetical protein QG629_741 [Patescibacteria group bacterium]|nr:PAS domain-containing protein [Candidatus Saccharibacteria bacterium]MDQ5963658.1 hypothetical protein [Patescibacteria group bacterium]
MANTAQTTQNPAESIALEHERLTSLINSMADGVIAVDEKVHIVLYNGAALNILDANITPDGQHLSKIVKIFDNNGQPVNITALIKGTTTSQSTRDYLLHYDDGSKVNLYLSIAPVRLGYGVQGQKGFTLLLRDITREKSLEEERDEFISVVSHELRTPIAIAEGNISNAQLVADRSATRDTLLDDALKVAHDQVVFLAGMINDLATLSRAERGVLKLEVEDINPHDLTETLIKTYTPDAVAKGLTLHCELSPHLETLQSSSLYVREVLQNFITNAIKYTEKGGVVVAAKPWDSGGVVFTVRDTGIGISKADAERVFDKFFRSEDFRTRQNSGTGLGLYVTMKLARMLHAEIAIDSELNTGSTFTIKIPNVEPEND